MALPDWYVAAGALRNAVWANDGAARLAEHDADVDVVFFDADDLTPERDARALAALRADEPTLPWEATNQALIHLWYRAELNVDVPAFASAVEEIARFPKTATCVGVRPLSNDDLLLLALCGLNDLRDRIWRRNEACPIATAFEARLAKKNVRARWPHVVLAH